VLHPASDIARTEESALQAARKVARIRPMDSKFVSTFVFK